MGRTSNIRLIGLRATCLLHRKESPSTASSRMWHSRGIGSLVVGRTEEERDLLRVEEESDVGGMIGYASMRVGEKWRRR